MCACTYGAQRRWDCGTALHRRSGLRARMAGHMALAASPALIAKQAGIDRQAIRLADHIHVIGVGSPHYEEGQNGKGYLEFTH